MVFSSTSASASVSTFRTALHRFPTARTMATQRAYASASLEAHSKLAKRKWLGVTVDGTSAKNFINGEFRESKATTFYDVHDPATQQVVTRVPQTTPEELTEAI